MNIREYLAYFWTQLKPFTVSIPLLISKLKGLDIRGLQLAAFKSYLTDRRHCVKIDSWTSEELSIEYGGSILGGSILSHIYK